MKRLFVAAVAMAVVFASCSSDKGVATTIQGRFVGSGVDTVYLERVSDNFTTPEALDRVALADNGGFKFEFGIEEGTSPRFYRLSFDGGRRPVTLVVAPGDEIKLESAGDIFLNYEVEGSEESALIKEFNREYFTAVDRVARIAEGIDTGEGMHRRAYDAACEAMQAQLRFVGTHRDRLAGFYAIRHTAAERYIPQLEGMGITVAHRRALVDGISERYPDSPYIAILEQEIATDETIIDLSNSVSEISYPDIELMDIYNKSHRLSSLDGKVILLYFWSAVDSVSNNVNAELKSLYERYHDKGFEVYQVSADADISIWIEAVRQQKLPWISVYGGTSPEVFSTYNVAGVPTAFLIDREGNMSVPSLKVSSLEESIKELI
ncbi:MAG: redoxin domain-containing protein [Alistipes sp.]|nr:redoxin domain-containing protein [Alistipes sp.]